MTLLKWSPWAWMPFVIIGITAIPNAILIIGAKQLNICKVEAHPWTAAERLDGEKKRRSEFQETNGVFQVRLEGRALTCTLEGGAMLTGASVRAYRPSNATQDQRWIWNDPTQPLNVTLPSAGRWLIHLDVPHLPAAATHAVDASL